MKLPFLTKKKDSSQYYLALLLTDEKAQAVILQEEEGLLEILNQHTEFFSSPIDEAPLEELIDIIDKAVSNAEEILPPQIETHKTIFGVKDDWVEDESKKITKEHLSQLKKVCSALDLSPIGFMVISEAIAHFMQEKEGAPLSAVLVDLGKKRLTIRLIRAGRVIETVQGEIEGAIPAAVDKLMQHLTTEVLPARIILIHEQSHETLGEQFAHHPWSKSIPFLHLPTVEVLPRGADGKAITYGAAAQMELAVKDTALPHPKNEPVSAALPTEEIEPTEEEAEITHKEKSDEESSTSITADNFGFVTDADITKTLHHPKQIHHEEKHHEVPLEPEHLKPSSHEPKHELHTEAIQHRVHHEKVTDIDQDDHPHKPKKRGISLPSVSLPKLSLPSLASLGKKKTLLFPIGFLVLIIIVGGGIIVGYLTQVKASVKVMVEPKMVETTSDVTFATNTSSDFSKHTIAARSITTQVAGQATTDATGKKDVGEKAKGTVTIYNNDSEKVTIDEGTEIKSSNGLTFTLDKNVSISSQSGDIFSGTKPGTADVPVTAREIGTDYNLPSGTKFAIGSNAELAAKNDSAFSGGSKKSVTVVDKADIATLKKALPKSLEGKAQAAIEQEGESGETVLPLLADSTITKESYSKEVGAEAKTVQLKATVTYAGLAYDDSELTNYAKLALQDEYSDSVTFADGSVTATVKNAKQKGGDDIAATVLIEGGLLPNLKPEDILKKIEGTSPRQAKEIITALPQVAESDITFSPNIPFLSMIAPRLPYSLSVQITSKK